MKITGKIERKSSYNDDYNSQGILVKKQWYNIKGTEEECRAVLAPIKVGDNVEFDANERREFKEIKVLQFEGEPKGLKDLQKEMSDCLRVAEETLKPIYPDFVNPDKIVDVAIAFLKWKIWGKQLDK